MPKDEFDFADPFELNGMALLTPEDTTHDMAETFIEEFMRMSYDHEQILALFRNPHYLGPNLIMEKRGGLFVRNLIAEVFSRWGRPVVWRDEGRTTPDALDTSAPAGAPSCANSPSQEAADESFTDPMGAPIPKLNLRPK